MTPSRVLPREISRYVRERDWGYRTPCWEWTGPVNASGYGTTTYGGRFWYVHRLTYTLHNGTIPKGHEIHHRCHRRRCCRPDHEQALTRRAHKIVTLLYRLSRALK